MRNPLAVISYFLLFATCNTKSVDLILPEPVTNQSSALVMQNGSAIVYTFFGLDSTKTADGVHRKSFKLNLTNGESARIDDVPDSLGRLASSASVIKNKIYIAGGYAVFADGSEKSSNQLYRFDPQNESFELLAPIPIPIDDHIQAVYQDSLLFLVSGWSDSANVSAVQIFDTARNSWQIGTSLPEELASKTFGGAGIIVNDTIYALGGATFTKFYPPGKGFYKGAISKNDPSKILWVKADPYLGKFRYRSAVFHQEGKIYFVGGSNETYNYNAISYAEQRPVAPNKTSLVYEISSGKFSITPTKYEVMDLRNLVHNSEIGVYLVGGILTGQEVSDQVIKLSPADFR